MDGRIKGAEQAGTLKPVPVCGYADQELRSSADTAGGAAMNKPDSALKDFIHVERGIIPRDVCSKIVSEIEPREWRQHGWYGNVQDNSSPMRRWNWKSRNARRNTSSC